MKHLLLSIALFIASFQLLNAQSKITNQKTSYTFEQNIPYQKGDEYILERCVLDVYSPESKEDLPVLIYFHGGGLKRGNKYIPEYLKEKGIIVVAVNYRFFPEVSVKEIIGDAAISVKWVYDHITKYGGNPNKIFLSGHSAGGYIISMLGLDASYLMSVGLDPNQIAGLIPLSGHTITHMTAREEMGIGPLQPTIDQMAPLFHVKENTPPYIMITGDRELELLGRYEENAYMHRMMKLSSNKKTELYELQGYGHMMVYPALPILLEKIKEISALK
jgi:acetyl esterase/lipase